MSIPQLDLNSSKLVHISTKNATCLKNLTDADIPLCKENFSIKASEVLNAFYKEKLPKTSEITVRDLNGKTVLWDSLTYNEKSKILAHHHRGGCFSLTLNYEGPSYLESEIPRWTHGLMHATRAGLLVRIAANMYQKYSGISISEKEILLAQYLAVFHDSARQAEGVDVWDDQSAENAYTYLIDLGFDIDTANFCVKILKEKDSPSKDKHILTKLIQCADCLDIMRIYGESGFKDDYLDIYNDLKNFPNFNQDLQDFKKQYVDFIRKTEAPLLRAYLEKNSSNYFEEVESLMLTKSYHENSFPLLSKWYNQASEKPSEITHLIFNNAHLPKWGEYTCLKTIGGGIHLCYLLIDKMGNLYFFKQQDEAENQTEEIGANYASLITKGLVPKVKIETVGSKKGVLQPYIELNKTLFKSYEGLKIEKLTKLQKKQLMVHMIADYAIRNYDAHTGQFGVDSKGNIIGIDKGDAFKVLRDLKGFSSFFINEPKGFNPNFYMPSIGNDHSTYAIYSNYLTKHLDEAKEILEDSDIQEAFKACVQIARSKDFSAKILGISKNLEGLRESIERIVKVEKEFKSYFK